MRLEAIQHVRVGNRTPSFVGRDRTKGASLAYIEAVPGGVEPTAVRKEEGSVAVDFYSEDSVLQFTVLMEAETPADRILIERGRVLVSDNRPSDERGVPMRGMLALALIDPPAQ